ncbi:MAG: hypothetical protein P4L10_02635 [Acidobacteriaceae bacterium]|nr:hypothetical protein [Acidobacteriaceae bacterium]
MQNWKTWNVEKWLFVLGGILCLYEWLQLCVKLIGKWQMISLSSHRDAMDFMTSSFILLVLLPNKKGRWLMPIGAAIFFQIAARLAFHSL